VPVSSGESISTVPADVAQESMAVHFGFFHYPHQNPQNPDGYPHSASVIHCLRTAFPQITVGKEQVPQELPASVSFCHTCLMPTDSRLELRVRVEDR
jgi:hypothetical protein